MTMHREEDGQKRRDLAESAQFPLYIYETQRRIRLRECVYGQWRLCNSLVISHEAMFTIDNADNY